MLALFSVLSSNKSVLRSKNDEMIKHPIGAQFGKVFFTLRKGIDHSFQGIVKN